MYNTISFPTDLHRQAAERVKYFFAEVSIVDTVLLVNSCARGQAVPESDLDFAVLVHPESSSSEQQELEKKWQSFARSDSVIERYKKSHRFAQIHLDVSDLKFVPQTWDDGGGPDYFEVEIGNRIAYSAAFGKTGSYFLQLKHLWLPYYEESTRIQRFQMARNACEYDLDHIPFLVKRGLYFQAFDRLYKSFQEFLQALFIKHKIYPIAYNKWIKEQVTTILHLPDLYEQLPSTISVSNLASDEIIVKGETLLELLNQYC